MNQFSPMLQGDEAIAVAGMRIKSMDEEVLSLPLMVDPAYPVVDGSPIFLTDDKKGCTTTENTKASFCGVVVLHGIGKSGKDDNADTGMVTEKYLKGDVVPVMVKGKLWVEATTKITDLTADVTATNGKFGSGTTLNGMRWNGVSVGSKNLTQLEIMGV